MAVALVIFAVCLAVCLYLYAGYPLLLATLARLVSRPVASSAIEPAVTVVIPAHNEAEVIAAKLDNSLALDYPDDRLEIVVVSDGSTDDTDDIVRRYVSRRAGPSIRLRRIARAGKAAALNAGVREASGEIVVFTDANIELAPGSLRALVAPFADPEVGGVCGHKRSRSGTGADATEEGEGLYLRYDTWQKRLESRIGSAFAADGALYAVRKERYTPIDDPAQADDIAISARIPLAGFRLVYAEEAVAWEEAPASAGEEFRRKVRVTNHSVRALVNLGSGLWRAGFYSVELVSHKLLRHLAPFFLIGLLLSNAVLALDSGLFALLLAAQLAVYVLALAGFLLRESSTVGRWTLLSTPYYFAMVNLAALLGVLSILRGERRSQWTPRHGM